ncbi:MAG: hypothetical protein HUJ25_07095 [Crocinitomicaceae bacterium]|nr:hypothetical protein [Crocinitomicaceae bacterium]
MIQEIKTSSATIRLISPGIIENIIRDNSVLDILEIKEIKAANEEMAEGKKYVLLINSGQYTSITKEGMELSASETFQRNTIAKALLVNSLGHRIVGNFYIKFNKPFIVTQIFSDRDKAISWLKTKSEG